jgi:hypothetical protein
MARRCSTAQGSLMGIGLPLTPCVAREPLGGRDTNALAITVRADIEAIAEQTEIEEDAALDLAARGWW